MSELDQSSGGFNLFWTFCWMFCFLHYVQIDYKFELVFDSQFCALFISLQSFCSVLVKNNFLWVSEWEENSMLLLNLLSILWKVHKHLNLGICASLRPEQICSLLRLENGAIAFLLSRPPLSSLEWWLACSLMHFSSLQPFIPLNKDSRYRPDDHRPALSIH